MTCALKLDQEIAGMQAAAQVSQLNQKIQSQDWTRDINYRDQATGASPARAEAFTVAPSGGSTLRVPLSHIRSVTEPQPFAVRVTLPDGTAIELARLGTMRTQLLAELRGGRAEVAAETAAMVGEAEIFGGTAGGDSAELRFYDDALLIGFGGGAGAFGGWGDYWAFRALGAGRGSPQDRPLAPRADVTRGRLTPATEDLSALAASDDDPTVLAFALGRRTGGRLPGLVLYEVLNQGGTLTYAYQPDSENGADELAVVNRALDDAGFQLTAVHAEGLACGQAPDARNSSLGR